MEEKKNGPPWGNIVTFAACALVVWLTAKRYQMITSIAYLYTTEELHQNLDAVVLVCALELISGGRALWELLSWKLSPDLTKGIWNLLGGFGWCLSLWLCTPVYWEWWMSALWFVVLSCFVGFGFRQLWRYRRQKLLEETF